MAMAILFEFVVKMVRINREAEEAEEERLAQEEIQKEKEARKEGLRKRKPVFTAKEKTDEELKGYSKLNLDLNKGEGVKAAVSKVRLFQHSFSQSMIGFNVV